MFKKATVSNIKIRLALSGAAGSGKTYSALAIASHLSNRASAVIDTERGSASRYANIFDFDACELVQYHPNKYIEAIKAAEDASYDVIIVDSLSHAWFAELQMVEAAKNSFTAWKDVRPVERHLLDTITGCKAHIICTMRSKTEWDLSQTEKGKIKPTKIGLAPIQTAGIEYEFDIAGEMSNDHVLHISKSRCTDLTDTSWLKPGKDFTDVLRTWIGTTAKTEVRTEVWSTWKSADDAIAWAARELPHLTKTELEQEFANLTAINGKKAPAWVAHVNRVRDEF